MLTLPSLAAFIGTILILFFFFKESTWNIWVIIMFAVHFYSIYLTTRFRSEYVFIFLAYAALWFYNLFESRRKYHYLALSFIFAIISAYTRTVGWILPACIALMLFKNKHRAPFWILMGGTMIATPLYLMMTEVHDYFVVLDKQPKEYGPLFQASVDAAAHFWRNMIDFFQVSGRQASLMGTPASYYLLLKRFLV